MDNLDVIRLVLKYFDFQQLCIAERINSSFQYCARMELRSLKHVDLGAIFSDHHGQMITKLGDHCPNLQRLSNFITFTVDFALQSSKKQYVPQLLSILQKLTCLEMNDISVEWVFSVDAILNLIDNAHNLQKLALRSFVRCDDEQMWNKFTSALIRHRALKTLSTGGGLWMDLPPCVNLTSLEINFGPVWNGAQCQQLYTLLAANQGLKNLHIHSIRADFLLFEKLTMLRKLKTLDLGFSCIYDYELDFVFRSSNIVPESGLCFDHLEAISISSEASRTYTDFIVAVLAHSPALKRCSLEWEERNRNFYPNIFASIIHPEQIECFTTNCRSTRGLHLAFLRELLPKMINLKHLHAFSDLCDYFYSNIPNNVTTKQLKYLDLSAGSLVGKIDLLKFYCSASIEGVSLLRGSAPLACYLALVDIIFEQCPNLRYLTISHLPLRDWIGKLSVKMRNLQFLRIDHFTNHFLRSLSSHPHPGVDELAYTLENLPNLRVFLVDGRTYTLLLKCEAVKRHCRRQRLSIMMSNEESPLWDLYHKWIETCCGSECVHSLFLPIESKWD